MSKSFKVVLAAAVCVCMVAMILHADGAAGSCEPVLTAMNSCRNYLKQGGAVPDDCCKGVQSLNAAAKTPAVKRSYCECLKSEAKSLGVNQQFASTLPKKCGVNIGYPISYNTNCTKIQ
ncbi:hypothetical protein C2S51_014696 [Perilla frutescens var. frutescens]|nr:hypothetical protein C2S51_014696 [Perilla frutescens var. frutescens]